MIIRVSHYTTAKPHHQPLLHWSRLVTLGLVTCNNKTLELEQAIEVTTEPVNAYTNASKGQQNGSIRDKIRSGIQL